MAKNKKIRTKIMLIFAAIVLLLAFLFMPVPYYLEMPGSAESISDYIKIDGKKTSKRKIHAGLRFNMSGIPGKFFSKFFHAFYGSSFKIRITWRLKCKKSTTWFSNIIWMMRLTKHNMLL